MVALGRGGVSFERGTSALTSTRQYSERERERDCHILTCAPLWQTDGGTSRAAVQKQIVELRAWLVK